MTHAVLRLPTWQRRVLHGAAWSLLATGVVWLAVHYSIGAGADELPHPLEVLCLRLHGAAAFVGLFALGVLAAGHVPAGWRVTRGAARRARRGAQRHTGVALLSLAAVLAGTGYALYYVTPEDWRPAVGWLHAGAGLLMAVLGVVHGRWMRQHGPAARHTARAAHDGAAQSAPVSPGGPFSG
ncbi:hypothetical protein [Ideonella sp.]|uniref:hypothetical protein n=1 Tax=Ideonella sp. TaxID=1929293 RepID=UPI002B48C30D|nr:hypothetical protein [Ideonella sp.]HJV70091.1 hypothetical protein [Ideonella sp.]